MFLDKGKTHASKDFWDPVKQRRIMWVWGTVPSGIQTIPREMTYHPGIKRIVYSPVTEMLALRTGSIDKAGATALKKGSSVPLKVSGACDIEVDFSVPTAATQLSVMIGGDAFFIAFTPESREASPASDSWKVDVGFGHFKDSLPLLSDDKQITMRFVPDQVE